MDGWIDGLFDRISILEGFFSSHFDKKSETPNIRTPLFVCYLCVSYQNVSLLYGFSRVPLSVSRNDDYYLIIVITTAAYFCGSFSIEKNDCQRVSMENFRKPSSSLAFPVHKWHSIFSLDFFLLELSLTCFEDDSSRMECQWSEFLRTTTVEYSKMLNFGSLISIWWTLVHASFEAWVDLCKRKPNAGGRKINKQAQQQRRKERKNNFLLILDKNSLLSLTCFFSFFHS